MGALDGAHCCNLETVDSNYTTKIQVMPPIIKREEVMILSNDDVF